MKKLIKAGLVFGLVLLFAGNVWALPIDDDDVVTLTLIDGNVGPYLMTNTGTGGNDWSSYIAFCVERNESFSPGSTYEYDVDSVVDYAENGGISGAVNGRDPISQVSLWLYASYFDGVFGSQTYALGHQVQKAIWYEEGEIRDTETTYLTDWKNEWDILTGYAPTDSITGGSIYTVTGWDIKVVNLSQNGVFKQSQLVGAPVPEPATMVLFGIGLLGLAGIGRKRTQK